MSHEIISTRVLEVHYTKASFLDQYISGIRSPLMPKTAQINLRLKRRLTCEFLWEKVNQ